MLHVGIANELYELMKEPPLREVYQRFQGFLEEPSWIECWEWKGSKRGSEEYGGFRLDGKTRNAHRLIMDWVHGVLPQSLVVDHIWCDNPACVNPLHMVPTDNKTNSFRSGRNAAAVNLQKTHCQAGHELAGENLHPTYLAKGQRVCHQCHKRKQAEYRKRKCGVTNL